MAPVRRRSPRRAPPSAIRQAPDLVVSGRTWARGKLQPVDLGIDADGRIVRVARAISGGRRRDFGDRVLLPSAIDLHVHFRDPGPPNASEEFRSGSLQAALGGVGLVADMPNTHPPTDSREHAEAKISRARGRLAVDAVLYGAAVNPSKIARIAPLVGAFKLYLAPTGSVAQTPPLPSVRPLLEAVAATGLALAVHAEDPAMFRPGSAGSGPVHWNSVRPSAAEESAVRALLPAPPGLRLHIAHVTQPEVASLLRAEGHSFEATPHHLLLDERSGPDARFKVNPPLRSPSQQAGLWTAFSNGEVPALASDHAPHSLEAKSREFDEAPSGMPGVETMLPLLLARVRSTDLPLPTLMGAASERPGLWLGVPQGRLAPGQRANLVVVDFRVRRRLRAEELHAPCGWTAFEGFEGIFPTDHLIDGHPIVEDGEYVGTPNGRLLRPDYTGAPADARSAE